MRGVASQLEALGEVMPPNPIARGGIIDVGWSQLRLDFNPNVFACRRLNLLLRSKLTRAHRLDERRGSLTGEVKPAGLESQRAEAVIDLFGVSGALTQNCLPTRMRLRRDGGNNFRVGF